MKRNIKDLPTSTTLLDLCRKNDPDAWERFLKLYKKLILFWIKEYNVPHVDSDDVLQDVMLTLSKQIVKFKKEANGKFRNWLRTIVCSRSMDYHNKNKVNRKKVSLSTVSKIPDPKFSADNITKEQEKKEREILGRQILSMIKDTCSPAHLKAFELVTVKGLTAVEAAQQLDMTPENVRQINCRIRKMIRDQFGDLL
ncbi:MAG: sigma-70 family RNA polymerase sigma factor [Thermoguttaceae bacterium]|nr:sigma-70 family RNA polymerase sigma factor [Thermoguttaceae bacterium]